ncbi:MAG TPA: hypothetical protein VFL43_04950 [Variovorax sp.]|nr:hypothetical protein [Variovorax sp.]
MFLTSKSRTRTAGAALALLGAVALVPLSAQGAESKVLNGIERGSDAAGRGIERGAHATRQGVDHTAERASAPVRRWGEALGRKITPAGSHKPAAPAVGPQGNSP